MCVRVCVCVCVCACECVCVRAVSEPATAMLLLCSDGLFSKKAFPTADCVVRFLGVCARAQAFVEGELLEHASLEPSVASPS